MKEVLKNTGLDFRIINPNLIDENPYKKYYHEKQRLGYSCELEFGTGLLFSNEFFLQKIKSVAVLFVPYLSKANMEINGNISKYAMGRDYHTKVKEYLEQIFNDLKKIYPKNEFYYQCDKGIVNERFYAGSSGLCTIGKNGSLIHEKYGSYGNLALIYSDLEVNEYKTDVVYCLNCGKCQKVCPANAIKANGMNCSIKCISYLTQKKKELTQDEISLIEKSGYIFGCDICQKICPLNKSISLIEAEVDYITNLKESDLKNISNKIFKEKYKEKAFTWRGKAVLLRNIKIINKE